MTMWLLLSHLVLLSKELLQMVFVDQLQYKVFQGLVIFYKMSMILMVVIVLIGVALFGRSSEK